MAGSSTNILWDLFEKVENGKAKCNSCKTILDCKGGTTSGLIKHLKSKHKELHENYVKSKEEKDNVTKSGTKRNAGGGEDIGIGMKQQKLCFGIPDAALAKKIDQAVVDFIAETGTAFRVVGQPSFKKLINIANNRIQLKDPKTYSRMTGAKAEEISQDISDIVQAVKKNIYSVGFTTDIWTSRANHSYICLTVHFIDKFWNLHRFTPYIRPFPERHTGANIALTLDSMISDLGLDNNSAVLYAVNDNASNMRLGIKLSDNLVQYLCDIHTIALAVKDTFDDVTGMETVLKKCKDLAKFTHQSTVAQGDLEKAAKSENIEFRKLKNPGETRWSSQHDTMESVLHLKEAIKKLCDENDDWADKTIARSGWKLIEGAVEILKPIRDTIKALEGEKEPTMHRVLERLYDNHYLLNKFINDKDNCQFGIGFARSLKRNLERRFPNRGCDVKERRFANYLAPQFKGVHLLTSNKLESTKEEIEAASNELENIAFDDSEVVDDIESDIELSPTSKLLKQSQAKFPQALTKNRSKIRLEMDRYESFSLVSKHVNVLNWWKKHEAVLPLLSKQAKKVLTIPASSAKSERVYSTGGNVVTQKRNRTAAKKVEALILIKENKSKVEDFKQKSGYEIKKTDTNPFKKVTHAAEPSSPNASDVFDEGMDNLDSDSDGDGNGDIILDSDSDNDFHYDM